MMDFNFRDNLDFKQLLNSKKHLILNRTTNNIIESFGYKFLFSNIKSLVNNNAFKGAKVILIKKRLLPEINLSENDKANELFSDISFATSDIIEINENFEIIDFLREELPKTSHEIRRYFLELCNNGYIVFQILESYINTFIEGDEFPESDFLTLYDKRRFLERKNVSQLDSLFDEYRERLKDQPVYFKFFIPKSLLLSYHKDSLSSLDIKQFIRDNAHILNNKCEDKFREDLRIFLKDNLNVQVIIKEYILDSKKRLDIFIADEFGVNFYLIEVKWVGESIHQEGKRKGTEYKAKSINPDAFYQTINYLKELDDKRENIVRAYLVVFDARKEEMEDTGENFDDSKLDEIQRKHYRKFIKVQDFRVKNIHPS
ncbi:hypothetical protein CMU11_00865 [Elizabethkingia anophelis]|uniref:hypothetical protein n=1 Tax=Elizabethkingia miricola TaxID=172045 RepID=UPI00099ACEB3|nr:hypothetical protein [Elizabethkingia miricola]MDV2493889.1 hypothetical protein [Elizabethkingia anophelis]MDV3567851.1 hypothetical protein [Elizabethkingia anophelis]MDV3633952.1 hypothetical protein [Elizabethkingia anophelis]MDV3708801.1 hypothetical protein [Elizabethkingia anophelis]MDV3732280.1 hypothetical protein [Elizabethkingia anophelis]